MNWAHSCLHYTTWNVQLCNKYHIMICYKTPGNTDNSLSQWYVMKSFNYEISQPASFPFKLRKNQWIPRISLEIEVPGMKDYNSLNPKSPRLSFYCIISINRTQKKSRWCCITEINHCLHKLQTAALSQYRYITRWSCFDFLRLSKSTSIISIQPW